MQLKTRLTFQFIAIVAPIIAISFVIIYVSSSNYREQEFYKRLKNKAITTAEFLIKVEQVDSSLLKIIDKTQKDHLPYENISIYDYKNREIYTNNDSIYFNVTNSLLNNIRLNESINYTDNGFEIIGLTFNDKLNRFVVISGAIDKFGLSKLRNLRNTLIILFFIIIGITALISRIFARHALKPIINLVNETKLISPANLNTRLNNNHTEDEINELITAFNGLLERIEEAFKIQKLFFASASHQLQNPLMAITTQLNVILKNDREKEEYKETIQSVLDDIKELNKLTIQLIELARLSFDHKDIPFKNIRIDEVMWSVLEFIDSKYPSYLCKFNIESMPEDENNLIIWGNETLLKTAIINLVENACKFSNNNTAFISLTHSQKSLKLIIADTGPGITVDEQKYIFEPFYRANSTSEIKGHGIGLSLVEKIIKLHNAEIILKNNQPSGCIFELVFSSSLTKI
jgi:signal transduction histidine kinase